MPESELNVRLEYSAKLVLTERELRALDGILGYDVNHFLKVFYERMGKAYVQPHEEGVRTLHKRVRYLVTNQIAQIDKARRALRDAGIPL